MDTGIDRLLPGELTAVAARLERHADRLDACAVQARSATATSWQGEAARLHRDVVGEHADDLATYARRVRQAAADVRHLQAVAESRLHMVGAVDLTARVLP